MGAASSSHSVDYSAAARPVADDAGSLRPDDVEGVEAVEIEGVAVELTGDGEAVSTGSSEPEVRALPVPRTASELEAWRGELRTIAVVAAGSIAAGVATVAAAGVAKSVGSRTARRSLRRRRERDIVASRSFLVDVHLLGR